METTLPVGGHGDQPGETDARATSTHVACVPWVTESDEIFAISWSTIADAGELVSHRVSFKTIRTP